MIIIDQPMNIRVDLDSNIRTLKPPKNETVGTLVITDAGLGFKIPRGKREPELVIPWDKMVQAVEILKNVPGFTVPSNAPLDVDFTKVRDAKPSDFDIGIDCSGPNAELTLEQQATNQIIDELAAAPVPTGQVDASPGRPATGGPNANEFRIPDADDHKTVERTFPEQTHEDVTGDSRPNDTPNGPAH